jgi:transglutaminase-like putative cysteine protease
MQNDDYTRATETIESLEIAVTEFASKHCGGSTGEVDKAVAVYYAVRDQIRYDPYRIDLTVDGLKASTTLKAGYGWCVSKAVLLAACCRALDIPARLGFADVRNHLSTARMRERMKTDIFYWHGYTEMLLEDKWVKATPAFNVELCKRFNLLPLEFDGRNDSLYHPFDASGQKHMEYVNQRGTYTDVPIAEIIQTFREKYWFSREQSELAKNDFEEDVRNETRK